jgi:hypothetical protein
MTQGATAIGGQEKTKRKQVLDSARPEEKAGLHRMTNKGSYFFFLKC